MKLVLLCLWSIFVLNCVSVSTCDERKSDPAKNKTVLFIVAWQKSHILGMQGVAEELAQRGYRVLFSSTDNDRHLISSVQAGVEFLSGGAQPKDDEYYNHAHTIEDVWIGQAEYARSMCEVLLPVLQKGDLRVDMIVSDPLSLAGEAIASKLGVPLVQVAPCLHSLAKLNAYPSPSYPIDISGLAHSRMNLADRLYNTLHLIGVSYGLPFIRGLLQNSFRRWAGLEPQWFEFQNTYGVTRPLIVGTLFGFELPQNTAPLTFLTGPFLPRAHRPLDTELQHWMDDQSLPLVFISIGTNSVWTTESLNAVVNAVLTGSVKEMRFRVLWSIKAHQQKMIDPDNLSKLQASSHVRLVSFVEQGAVLEHHNTKLFLTHAGLGSLQEALYNGVPMVVMPMMFLSDQPTNAARLDELGAAIWIDRRNEEVNSVQLLESFSRVLPDNSSFRSEAQRFRQLYRLLNGRKRAADLLETFMHPIRYHELLQPVDTHILSNWDVYGILLLLLWSICKLFGLLCGLCCGKASRKKHVKED